MHIAIAADTPLEVVTEPPRHKQFPCRGGHMGPPWADTQVRPYTCLGVPRNAGWFDFQVKPTERGDL